MKKIKYIAAALATALIVTNCEYEPVIYDNVNGQSLLSFDRTTLDVPVDIDTGNFERSQEITVLISTISSEDRTFQVAASDESTVDPSNYQLPTSITVPADSYSATFSIDFQDADLETVTETLILELTGEGVSFDAPLTLNVFQVCPIPDTYFVGAYQCFDVTSRFGIPNFDEVVDVQIGDTATSRVFTTNWFNGPDFQVTLNLVCNQLIFSTTSETGYVAGTPQEPIVVQPAAENSSTYDLSDDSFFSIEYDNNGGAGATSEQEFGMLKL